MDHEHELPPEHDHEHPDAEIEEMLTKARRAGDPWSMPPPERDAFMAGYYVGRESGYDAGYAAGYEACDAEIARLQRAAVAASRGGEAWPSMNPDNYWDGLCPDPFTPPDEKKTPVICPECRDDDHEHYYDTKRPEQDYPGCACQHQP